MRPTDGKESEAQWLVHYGEMWKWGHCGGEEQMDMRSLSNHGDVCAVTVAKGYGLFHGPIKAGACADVCGLCCH